MSSVANNRNTVLATTPFFVSPSHLFRFASPKYRLNNHCKSCRRRPLVYRNARINMDSQNGWQSRSSSALDQENPANRYIDLRTMKVIHSDAAHIVPGPTPGATFGIFDNEQLFADAHQGAQLRELLFTEDTIPLSDAQKQVVQALFSRRSVLHMSAAGEEKDAIFIDIVMRNRLWKECVVYCAASRRAAENIYATLCAQLGSERRGEVHFDFGDCNLDSSEGAQYPRDTVRVIITCPHVLKTKLVTCDLEGGWVADVSIVFIDNFSLSALAEWEELLLAMPSRILLCMFAKELSINERELLPLWLETIQNNFVAISPLGAASLLDRIERPQNFPLLRSFAFNAAVHKSPVQVSLTLLKDMLQKEADSLDGKFVPSYEECFLHGITMIPAEDPATLEFRSVEEAEYADVSSLIVADAKRTAAKVRTRSRKRTRTAKRKERTASSRAAARRRREAAYADSLLLPAIVMIKGQQESGHAAFAIQSSLGEDTCLLWDEDSKQHLEDIIDAYERAHEGQLCDVDLDVLKGLSSGIGIVHDGCAPAVRVFVEELFRGGLIPLIMIDTHLGSKELLALPCAKSVLIESSALAVCDDPSKGLVMASTAASLAGRVGKDDVGNLIVLWYDESVDDEAAGSDISTTLLYPLFSDKRAGAADRRRPYGAPLQKYTQSQSTNLEPGRELGKPQFSLLASSYDGILRSLRRFGVDGYESILDYTLLSYKGWLERAALHATLEKMEIEKRAIDDALDREDWASIADYERRAAKRNEANRVFNAMQLRYNAVVSQRLQSELQVARPGKIIGVECSKGTGSEQPWEQKLLEGSEFHKAEDKQKGMHPATTMNRGQDEKENDHLQPKRDNVSAAVFVAVRKQDVDGNRLKSPDCQWLVVCILADGMWTMVPMTDVVALSVDEDEVVPNVDLLMIPHPATFDIDPSSEWAKCCPIDDTEKAAVHRVSDELIARVASPNRPVLERYQIPEFEAQKERTERAQSLYQQSPWYRRDNELGELRRLRRRSAELGDEIELLQKKEARLEERLFDRHNEETANQSSILAVLEDCHAVSILGGRSMEMTPIGALGSILPGQYPLFAGACLSLIDDVDTLSPAEFAAFAAIVVCSGRIWSTLDADLGNGDQGELHLDKSLDDELDMSILQQNGSMLDSRDEYLSEERKPVEIEGLDGVLPQQIVVAINDILVALHQLHRRHQDERGRVTGPAVSDIVPSLLNIRMARAAAMFASGTAWRDVADVVQQEGGYAVRELRNVKCVLDVIATSETGDFSETIRGLARNAYHALDRWPVRDHESIVELVESGVVEKHWSGNTYEKWWRGVRDRIATLDGAAAQRVTEEVESVEAEIMES